jgi:hypothetical protein
MAPEWVKSVASVTPDRSAMAAPKPPSQHDDEVGVHPVVRKRIEKQLELPERRIVVVRDYEVDRLSLHAGSVVDGEYEGR